MTMPFVQTHSLNKSYGKIKVLHDVSIDIHAREAHVVIGPNGAGKTTLFKVLTGEVLVNSGAVLLQGKDITKLSAHERIHLGFGRTFQVAKVFGKFSVYDNLRVTHEARLRRSNPFGSISSAQGRHIEQCIAQELKDIGLERQSDAVAGALAYGDRKRLELAMVLALEPTILFLDEPTAGMSAAERQSTLELLLKIKKEKQLSILLTEHDLAVVFGLADRISVMHYGKLIATGTPDMIRDDARVQEVYLGHEDNSHA
jgi:branched-chain amino acid transport system ATP-binding protein